MIYVDELVDYQQKATSGGRYFGSGKSSCHMMTDGDLEELHQFAERIGLKRTWFQNHPRHPHYDLTPSKRAQAVRLGAVEVMAMEWARKRLAERQRPCDSCGDPLDNLQGQYVMSGHGRTREVCHRCMPVLQADGYAVVVQAKGL